MSDVIESAESKVRGTQPRGCGEASLQLRSAECSLCQAGPSGRTLRSRKESQGVLEHLKIASRTLVL